MRKQIEQAVLGSRKAAHGETAIMFCCRVDARVEIEITC